MSVDEQDVEVGDFVKINNCDYSGLNFVIGEYYEVVSKRDGQVGLLDGSGKDSFFSNGWTFDLRELDDVRKKNEPEQLHSIPEEFLPVSVSQEKSCTLEPLCKEAKCDVTIRQDGLYEVFDNILDTGVEVDSYENLLKTLDKIIQIRKLESEIGYKF